MSMTKLGLKECTSSKAKLEDSFQKNVPQGGIVESEIVGIDDVVEPEVGAEHQPVLLAHVVIELIDMACGTRRSWAS